jgi:integrase
MTIEKRGKNYRVKQMIDGRVYSVSVPYKPTKKEAFELLQAKINHIPDIMTFAIASEEYISVKKAVLSPSTILGYTSMQKSIPKWFNKLDITEIDNHYLQKLVSEYSADHSPKSVHNLYGFVRASIRMFLPQTTICATLPSKPRHEAYTPTREDVKKILEDADGTPYYIPIYLAMFSLRNSEICALSIFDLSKDDIITINKALVKGSSGYVLKPTPKTDKSNREIKIPHDLAERIRKQGYIYKGYPLQITRYLVRTQKKLNIPHFGIHRLRHYFASYAHELGYSDAVIQAVGGWSTDHVMKSVYRHAMNSDEAKNKMVSDLSF